MTEIAEKLREELLQLPSQDRAELAYCLIRSLDDKDDPGIQAAWEAELERRWQEMESGELWVSLPTACSPDFDPKASNWSEWSLLARQTQAGLLEEPWGRIVLRRLRTADSRERRGGNGDFSKCHRDSGNLCSAVRCSES